jgi:hypothetical protein
MSYKLETFNVELSTPGREEPPARYSALIFEG